MAEGYHSEGGNAEKGRASALQLHSSRYALPLASFRRKPRRIQRSLAVEANSALRTGAKSVILDCLVINGTPKAARWCVCHIRRV